MWTLIKEEKIKSKMKIFCMNKSKVLVQKLN